MRKFLVLFTATLLIVACAISFSSCSVLELIEDGVDIVLGASQNMGETADGDEKIDFSTVGGSVIAGLEIPTVDVPDSKPATEGLHFALNSEMTAYCVISYTSRNITTEELSTEVYIPYTYNDLPVILIAPGAFNDTNIESVTLPKTLLAIGEKAFKGSTVKSLNIPASVVDIASDAFIDCTALTSISVDADNARYSVKNSYLLDGPSTLLRGLGNGEIGAEVTKIAPYAYRGCHALTEIVVPETVTEIGKGAFLGCANLASAELASPVAKLADNIFDHCTALTSVSYPSTVTEIGYAAFRDSALAAYTVPDGITSIDAYAFANSSSLASITLPDSLTVVGGGAFENCILLTAVSMPDNITSVTGNLFRGCISLRTVKLPENATVINDAAFSGCVNLTEIVIPASVKTIGSYVFYGVGENTVIFCGSTHNSANWSAQWACYRVDNGLESGSVSTVSYYLSHALYFAPDKDGNGPKDAQLSVGKYWRYVDGVPTLWEKQPVVEDGTGENGGTENGGSEDVGGEEVDPAD